MPILTKALAVLGTTGALLVGVAAPASANHQCLPDDLLCVITPATTIPVGTPVLTHDQATFSVRGPDLCDPACRETWIDLPGAYVSTGGTTLVTIDLPEYGVRVDSTGLASVHYGIPVVTPGSPALGATLIFRVSSFPLRTVPTDTYCDPMVPQSVGPVSISSANDCYVTIQIVI